MTDTATIKRQLKIKTGSVNRLFKEQKSYRDEAVKQQIKLDKCIADNADSWEARNARTMMEESNKMITHSAQSLGLAAGELKDLVVSAEKIPEANQDQDFLDALLKAKDALETASV